MDNANGIPQVIAFWREAGYDRWFNGGAAFDGQCRERLLDAHFAAARREHDDWMESGEGALALLILLDQIPRNVFRGSAHAFATDPLALHYARRAVDAGLDAQVDAGLRAFVYLPFEHSEALDDQHRAVALFDALGDAGYAKYARAHLEVIERFGRFPHRNHVLGRINTPQEQAWLDAGGGF
ncbi:DUF924 domain-containing protein [Luteimonas viscosa]|uniref:DUF924 domain-containing protein n=1 Tax=Luteimonas viscosa TaxID=1132694 RepID=A0A5D4XNE1_9GAMM|nr:DUF924 family protein [Luteimonas viscosa]TYT26197.1 DUF924 domain-containing protein [Luteimonas viscosa]